MAKSKAHRWGQIIGELLEQFVRNVLAKIACKHDLFLDFKHARKARGGKKKVTWKDDRGNNHDLDYVLERGGTEEKVGTPVAFIESLWRRYTKHSKNKAQEVESAVLSIAKLHANTQPICGVVLAGEFTKNAVDQMMSKGFTVLRIPYKSIIKAFAALKINAASEDGRTSEKEFEAKIKNFESLNKTQIASVFIKNLQELHKSDILQFIQRIESAITRKVTSVRLTFWQGNSVEFPAVDGAISLLVEIVSKQLPPGGVQVVMFEVEVRFNNGARIEAKFPTREEAISFLRTFA